MGHGNELSSCNLVHLEENDKVMVVLLAWDQTLILPFLALSRGGAVGMIWADGWQQRLVKDDDV